MIPAIEKTKRLAQHTSHLPLAVVLHDVSVRRPNVVGSPGLSLGLGRRRTTGIQAGAAAGAVVRVAAGSSCATSCAVASNPHLLPCPTGAIGGAGRRKLPGGDAEVGAEVVGHEPNPARTDTFKSQRRITSGAGAWGEGGGGNEERETVCARNVGQMMGNQWRATASSACFSPKPTEHVDGRRPICVKQSANIPAKAPAPKRKTSCDRGQRQ